MAFHAFKGSPNELGPASGFLGTFLDDLIATVPILDPAPSLASIVRHDAAVDHQVDLALTQRVFFSKQD